MVGILNPVVFYIPLKEILIDILVKEMLLVFQKIVIRNFFNDFYKKFLASRESWSWGHFFLSNNEI